MSPTILIIPDSGIYIPGSLKNSNGNDVIKNISRICYELDINS